MSQPVDSSEGRSEVEYHLPALCYGLLDNKILTFEVSVENSFCI